MLLRKSTAQHTYIHFPLQYLLSLATSVLKVPEPYIKSTFIQSIKGQLLNHLLFR